jgi:hypothetical protein
MRRANLKATGAIKPLVTVAALVTRGGRGGPGWIEWVGGHRMVIRWCGTIRAEVGSAAWAVRSSSVIRRGSCVVRRGRAGIAAGGGERVAAGIGLWGSAAAWHHIGWHPAQVILGHSRVVLVVKTGLRETK